MEAETGELNKELQGTRKPSGTALIRSRSLRQPTIITSPNARRSSFPTSTMVDASQGTKAMSRARDVSLASQARNSNVATIKRCEHIRTQSLGGAPSLTPTSNPRTPQVGRQLANHNRTTSLASTRAGGTGRGSVLHSSASAPTKNVPQPFRKHPTSIKELSNKSLGPIRPSYTTYQQRFTPTKQPTYHAAKGPSTHPPPPSLGSLPKNTHVPLRIHLQTHLLHLHLLHSHGPSTHTQWLQSAHTKLHAHFDRLLASYHETVSLERTDRQHRNLLALHQWCSGNIPSLSRKLNSLTSILTDLCALTAGDPRSQTTSGQAEEQGPYTHLISQFSRWVAWVRTIWAARDAAGKDDGQGTNLTSIEALGDGVKAEMRRLGDALAHISLRLEDLRAVKMSDDGARKGDGGEEESTPAALLDMTWHLTRNMVEELQVMREVEFEVVAGEKAWTENRINGIAGEVEAGLWG